MADGSSLADDDRPVLVHDGARPLVSPALVSAIARATVDHGAAIPVLPVTETLKRVDGDRVSATVDRSGLATAQTPQGVRRGLLRQALATASATGGNLTDEAGLLEASAIAVHTVPGEPGNVKVTVPADLARVEAVLNAQMATRVGLGTDRHAFGPGEPLRLGGIEIAGAARLHGHSDGDAALHAIASAILSAAGLGDLGRLFPADERTRRGADSGELLDEAVRRIGEASWRVSAVSVAIEGARPRLGGHLDRMRDAIAGHLGLAADAVAVTASTGNLSSAEGAGRSIAVTALATLAQLPAR
jgi:2-C-methyl-D-erythritol 2,4-cyclodiphosphate synthase